MYKPHQKLKRCEHLFDSLTLFPLTVPFKNLNHTNFCWSITFPTPCFLVTNHKGFFAFFLPPFFPTGNASFRLQICFTLGHCTQQLLPEDQVLEFVEPLQVLEGEDLWLCPKNPFVCPKISGLPRSIPILSIYAIGTQNILFDPGGVWILRGKSQIKMKFRSLLYVLKITWYFGIYGCELSI